MLNEMATVPEPQQLTLWPDDALPGQMPLFGRNVKIVRLSEMAAGFCVRCEAVMVRHLPGNLCFHCEDLSADYLASRGTLVNKPSPAAQPVWEPVEWFGKRPPMDLVRAANSYL